MTAQMLAARDGRLVWVDVDLPGGCSGWNWAHDCGREDDHPGDHVCVGCHDQWNRGEWDEEPEDGWWDDDRPSHDDRCVSRAASEVPGTVEA